MSSNPADTDRTLIERCLGHEPGAWNDFVDKYVGLLYHVVRYTAHLRSVVLRPEDVEDVVSEIFVKIIANRYAILQQFEGRSTLATYLTVIARRICIHELHRRQTTGQPIADGRKVAEVEARPTVEPGLDSLEQVHQLLTRLPKPAREVVRLFYLEGRSYEEISTRLHIPVNSIGPILSRAKQLLRKRLQAKQTKAGK